VSHCASAWFQRECELVRGPGRGWHESRVTPIVLIAVPNCQGRVSPVFDVAARLVLVRLKGQAELGRRDIVLFEKQPDGIVRSLGELGVQVLICGAISRGLQLAMEQAGIRVVSHICGGLERVISAFRVGTLGQLEFAMPGCCGRRWGAGWRGARCRKGANSKAGKNRAART
jgi:predicted Fe-Mo cluster-binding NifX family protein